MLNTVNRRKSFTVLFGHLGEILWGCMYRDGKANFELPQEVHIIREEDCKSNNRVVDKNNRVIDKVLIL